MESLDTSKKACFVTRVVKYVKIIGNMWKCSEMNRRNGR